MHVACLSGNTVMLRQLLEAGGDLRLHDRDGKTPADWAMRQGDSKRRRRTLEFIDRAREKALCNPTSTASTSKHIIELPAGLRFPYVLYLHVLLCSFSQLNCASYLLLLHLLLVINLTESVNRESHFTCIMYSVLSSIVTSKRCFNYVIFCPDCFLWCNWQAS